MQVLLLATNETTKLEPISNTLPASLIPVINRPVMEILIESLARKGFKKLLVSLYWTFADLRQQASEHMIRRALVYQLGGTGASNCRDTTGGRGTAGPVRRPVSK